MPDTVFTSGSVKCANRGQNTNALTNNRRKLLAGGRFFYLVIKIVSAVLMADTIHIKTKT
ncbi:MAG: hypothetical protein LBB81_02540 [Treponema sp.]|nr:hypothetical protein [Treponema sp.]